MPWGGGDRRRCSSGRGGPSSGRRRGGGRGRPGGGQGCGGGLREARSPWSNASTAIVQTAVEMTEEEEGFRQPQGNLPAGQVRDPGAAGGRRWNHRGDGGRSELRPPRWSAYCATGGGVPCSAGRSPSSTRTAASDATASVRSTDTPLVRLDVGSRGTSMMRCVKIRLTPAEAVGRAGGDRQGALLRHATIRASSSRARRGRRLHRPVADGGDDRGRASTQNRSAPFAELPGEFADVVADALDPAIMWQVVTEAADSHAPEDLRRAARHNVVVDGARRLLRCSRTSSCRRAPAGPSWARRPWRRAALQAACPSEQHLAGLVEAVRAVDATDVDVISPSRGRHGGVCCLLANGDLRGMGCSSTAQAAGAPTDCAWTTSALSADLPGVEPRADPGHRRLGIRAHLPSTGCHDRWSGAGCQPGHHVAGVQAGRNVLTMPWPRASDADG